MHHFIFSKADTFITNDGDFAIKNFGRDENITVSVKSTPTVVLEKDTIYINLNEQMLIIPYCNLDSFTGIVDGDLDGASDFITGSVSGSNNY